MITGHLLDELAVGDFIAVHSTAVGIALGDVANTLVLDLGLAMFVERALFLLTADPYPSVFGQMELQELQQLMFQHHQLHSHQRQLLSTQSHLRQLQRLFTTLFLT